jgi:hypothetical protein
MWSLEVRGNRNRLHHFGAVLQRLPRIPTIRPQQYYRHAYAFGLFAKRQRNIQGALERIIEKAVRSTSPLRPWSVPSQAYSKINSMGQCLYPDVCQRSVGLSPVFLAIRANITGPSSSPSSNAHV